MFFSKMLISFAKRKFFWPKRKYRRIKKKRFKQKHLTARNRCVIVDKVNAVKLSDFTDMKSRNDWKCPKAGETPWKD